LFRKIDRRSLKYPVRIEQDGVDIRQRILHRRSTCAPALKSR
jgi:hypothetical protein